MGRGEFVRGVACFTVQKEVVSQFNERIQSGEKETAKDIDSYRKQIESLTKRQEALDASLAASVKVSVPCPLSPLPLHPSITIHPHVDACITQEHTATMLSDQQLREIVRLLNENRVVSDGSSLDEDQIKTLVREELGLFAADRLNMTDWALGAAGGRILYTHTSARYGSSVFGYLLGQVSEPPSAILTVRNQDDPLSSLS